MDCLLKGPGWRVVDEPETAAMGGVAGEGGGRWKSSGTKGKLCSEGEEREAREGLIQAWVCGDGSDSISRCEFRA